MAENVLPTRLLLRYATYSQWMNSNVILKKGEAAIAIFADAGQETSLAPIGMKVGDGQHYFYELPWIQGVAADVYNWAKQATKPTYTAEEIQNLDTYIATHGGGGGEGGTSIAREYSIVSGNDSKYYLQYRDSGDTEWTTDASSVIDLARLTQIYNWIGNYYLTEYLTLAESINTRINTKLENLSVNDSPSANMYVSAVSQTNGKISVSKDELNFTKILGTVPVSKGGTGLTSIEENHILVGNTSNGFTTRAITNTIEYNTSSIPTSQAVFNYVENKTDGIANSMHFIGEANVLIDSGINSTVDPRIPDYDFRRAKIGDVILYEKQEYLWTGSRWRLFGDEGSYAVKGSIVDADISPDAAISISKILNLSDILSSKVNIIEGKQLSTNDYTTEEKNKLENIEDGAERNAIQHIFVNDNEQIPKVINGLDRSIALSIDVFDEAHATKLDNIQDFAQVNTIEHIFLNNVEQRIGVVNNLEKSVNILINEFTVAEKTKLEGIENGAQENKIEEIIINGDTYRPDGNKKVEITIDQAALNLNVLAGARVPIGLNNYEEVDVTTINGIKKLELSRVSKTGNIAHLIQSNSDYITLYCGTSTDVI